MTSRTPKTPADGSPRAVRAAQAEPGGSCASSPPEPGAQGGQMSPQPSRERAAAGKPDPVTGAALGHEAAPGQGRARSSSLPPTGPTTGAAGNQTPPGGRRRRAAGMPPGGSSLIAAAMSEAELDIHVRALVKDLGLLRYHTHRSDKSPSGFPDLVIVGQGVIYRELKTAKGKVSDAQAEWLHALVMAGQDACVWRPADLLSGLIGRRLAALAGIRAAAS